MEWFVRHLLTRLLEVCQRAHPADFVVTAAVSLLPERFLSSGSVCRGVSLPHTACVPSYASLYKPAPSSVPITTRAERS